MNNNKDLKVVSHKEAHHELQLENEFLSKKHDIESFKNNRDVLLNYGFNLSKTTKLYHDIAENQHIIHQYKRAYNAPYFFLLSSQMERILEHYNLYMRKSEFFMEEIPENNILDLQNFSVRLEDLDIHQEQKNQLKYELNNTARFDMYDPRDIMIPSSRFKEFGLDGFVEVSALKHMFHDSAFINSEQRMIKSKTNILPKAQVDKDPVITFRTKHGYIIITAWGDEFNEQLNAKKHDIYTEVIVID